MGHTGLDRKIIFVAGEAQGIGAASWPRERP